MKRIYLLLLMITLVGCNKNAYEKEPEFIKNDKRVEQDEDLSSHPLVEASRDQIGVVTQYDTSYYDGGYPPEDRGACTDVVEQALRMNGFDLKQKIDEDMLTHPEHYSTNFDPNINFRRVRNVQVYLENHVQNLSLCTTTKCFKEGLWQPGDIVTFEQIPGSLWHIAIVSDETEPLNTSSEVEIPLLIHNYGFGVVENNKLLTWPAPIMGHFRLTDEIARLQASK